MNELYLLEVGIYKNYKELCKALNWKVTGGTAKKAQLRTLDTLCKWHKEGNKIVVTEIYTEPKEKIDNRVNNGGNSTSKYNVDDNLIELLRDNKKDCLTLVELMEGLGITKTKCKKELLEIIENESYKALIAKDVENDLYSKGKSIIETALNRLQKKNIINSWDYTYCASGKECTNEEKTLIEQTEQEILEKYYDNKPKYILYITGNFETFVQRVKKAIRAKNGAFLDYYKGFIIDYNKEELKSIETNVDKEKLNNLIAESCLKSANKRHLKAKDKYCKINNVKTIIGMPKHAERHNMEVIRAYTIYIDICERIINKVIRIKI